MSNAFDSSFPPKFNPLPENSTYFGGGGGLYSSFLLSSISTSNPLGYLVLSSVGTTC